MLAGWQCCDWWHHWDELTEHDRQVASASLISQISRLRSHPCLLAWMNGSVETPPPSIEQGFLNILKERRWPAAVLGSAADRTSMITGPKGVKMTGPYDYVPPEYWYLDSSNYGGAWGFNTETSPGPAIPTVAGIRKVMPPANWWPADIDQDPQWTYHAGLGKFAQCSRFNTAMKRRTVRPEVSNNTPFAHN